MTALTITPNVEKKTMKFAGRVASGEKVSLTLVGMSAFATDAKLQVRVVVGKTTVGVFPSSDEEAWTVEGENLACELNLATLQAKKCSQFGGDALWLVEDVDVPQLYAAGEFELLPWVKRKDDDGDLTDISDRYDKDEIVAHVKAKGNVHGVTAEMLGLGSVDNTADKDKPVSTAQEAAITAAVSGVTTQITTESTRAVNAENALAKELTEFRERFSGIDEIEAPKAALASLKTVLTKLLDCLKGASE